MDKNNTRKRKKQPQSTGYYQQRIEVRLVFLPSKRNKSVVELHTNQSVRRLGSVDKLSRTFERTMPSDQIHKNEGGIGINQELLFSNRFDYIKIFVKDTKQVLETTTAYFLAHSRYVCYNDYEAQKILQIEKFGLQKAKRWEAGKTAQQELPL